ncbi:MAG: hypothetical protein ACYCZ6_18360 [Polaromonas sp.]
MNHDITTQEIEIHIKQCGQLMQDAYARYEVSGDFSERGEADAWRMTMERAIALRSPAVVASMEAERGIV